MVFVIDDNPTILRVVRAALEQFGEVRGSVLWSDISKDVLTQTSDGFDLLICDLDMPGIRGDEFCQIVRRYRPELPIIIYTGSPDDVPPGVADQVIPKRDGVAALVAAVNALKQTRPAEQNDSCGSSSAELTVS